MAAPTQRAKEAAARAFLKQNAQYGLLLDEDEEDGATADLPAPTTAALPKKKTKKLKKDKAGVFSSMLLLTNSALHCLAVKMSTPDLDFRAENRNVQVACSVVRAPSC